MILISITLYYCRWKTLLCRQHVWLFLIPSRGSNIVERGDLQSQKKSHIEKEEAGGCLVVIYHCQRTSEGRGIRVFCLKIFQQEIHPITSLPLYVSISSKNKINKSFTVKQQNIVQDWMRLFLRVHTSGNVNLSQTKVKMRRKFCRNWNSEQNFPTWKKEPLFKLFS